MLRLEPFCLLYPIEKWFLDKDFACVKDKALALAEGSHCMDHGLLVGTLEWVRCYYTFYLLCKSKGHQFWYSQLDTAAKGNSKVDSKHFTVSGID